MTFLTLFNRIGKQTPHVNKQKVHAVISVSDLKAICQGKAEHEVVSIPLTLKFNSVKGGTQMFFILKED